MYLFKPQLRIFFYVVKFKHFTPLRASEYDINIISCYVHCEKYNNIKLQVIPQRTEMEICSYIISYNVQFMGCKDRVMNWKLQVFNSSHIHKLFYSSEIQQNSSEAEVYMPKNHGQILRLVSRGCDSTHFHQPFGALISEELLLQRGGFCHWCDFLLFVVTVSFAQPI